MCRNTGTTYIGHQLSNISTAGGKFHFPLPRNHAHHYFADYIRLKQGSLYKKGSAVEKDILRAGDELVKHLTGSAIGKSDSVILSSAAFSVLSVKDLEYFKSLLPNYRYRVVLFYRDLCSWAPLMYEQTLQTSFLPFSFAAFLMQHKQDGLVQTGAYLDIYRRYVDTFTPQHVRIVDYNGAQGSNIDLVSALFVAADLTSPVSNGGGKPVSVEIGTRLEPMERLMRQLWRLFDYYTLSKHGCTTLDSKKKAQFKTMSFQSTRLGVYVDDIPRVEIDTSLLQVAATRADRDMRAAFGDLMIFANSASTEKAITLCPHHVDILVEEVLLNSEWMARFEEQYQLLSESKLSCTKKR